MLVHISHGKSDGAASVCHELFLSPPEVLNDYRLIIIIIKSNSDDDKKRLADEYV